MSTAGDAAAAATAHLSVRALQDDPIFNDGSNYLAVFVCLVLLVLFGVRVPKPPCAAWHHQHCHWH